MYGRSVEDLSSMTAYELLELTFESDKARQTIICPVALHLQGAPLSRGQGAFAVALSLFYTTAVAIGGNEALVDALSRCFLDHGGTSSPTARSTASRSATGAPARSYSPRRRPSRQPGSRPGTPSSPTSAPARHSTSSASRR